jgi:hypothetical protein
MLADKFIDKWNCAPRTGMARSVNTLTCKYKFKTQGPPLINLVTLFAFWKRKETPSAPERERIIPLPSIPEVSIQSSSSTSEEAVNHARETLKVLKLEKQILGTALTTIYESHSKGLINETERDRLLEKYKVDLTSLEKSIEENQRVVDLFDLEVARGQLVQDFKARLEEIDVQVKTLKSGGSINRSQMSAQAQEKKGNPGTDEDKKGKEQPKKRPSETEQEQISDSEKRIEQIRAEILQAMDRLEQIESEG